MPTCNKPVKTVDVDQRPCKCVLGHAEGCNPFSPNPYMAAVIAKADLPKGDKMPLPIVTPQFEPQVGVVWTQDSPRPRCLWQGAHGRCVYQLSNHTQHKEETSGH
jgi:hypothetical protein